MFSDLRYRQVPGYRMQILVAFEVQEEAPGGTSGALEIDAVSSLTDATAGYVLVEFSKVEQQGDENSDDMSLFLQRVRESIGSRRGYRYSLKLYRFEDVDASSTDLELKRKRQGHYDSWNVRGKAPPKFLDVAPAGGWNTVLPKGEILMGEIDSRRTRIGYWTIPIRVLLTPLALAVDVATLPIQLGVIAVVELSV